MEILLPKALYITGVVRDHRGQAFAGVKVQARMPYEKGYGDIATTVTDNKGRFEIFDYPLKKRPGERGELTFSATTATVLSRCS